MATRVNTRFVVILSVSLIIVFGGVVAAGIVAFTGQGERDVAKADALMLTGEIEDAARLYERSVGRDTTRQDWLEKWIVALKGSTPQVLAEYQQWYEFYRNSLRRLAELRRDNPEAQIRYVTELDRFVRESGNSRVGLEFLASEAEARTRDLDPEDPKTHQLLRFRGLALVDQMSLLTIDQAKREQAISDLENAIAADPSDWQAKLGLVRWNIAESDRLVREGKAQDATKERTQAQEKLSAFLAQNPEHPEAMLMSFQLDQEVVSKSNPAPEVARAANEQLTKKAIEVLAAAVATPSEQMRSKHVQRLVAVLSRGLPVEHMGGLQEVLDRAIAQYPEDAALLISKGSLLLEMDRVQAAMDELQKVVDKPAIPISLEGLMLPSQKNTAYAMQIDGALRLWAEAQEKGDDTTAKAALAQAKKYRDSLASNTGVRSRSILLLRDAKLAMAEQRYPEAVQLLSEVRSSSEDGSTIEVVQLLAQALEQQGSLGEARRLYQELVQRAPNMAWAQVKSAEMCVRLGDLQQAVGFYATALRLEPANQEYQRRLKSLQSAIASSTVAGAEGSAPVVNENADPVISAIVESRRLRVDDNLPDARRVIEESLAEHPGDIRLVRELLQVMLRQDQRAEAVAFLEQQIAANPQGKLLQQMLLMVQADDPVDGQLAIIEQSDLSESDKAIERFEVFMRAGRGAEAEAALAEASRLAPHDVRVLDYSFVVALNKGEKEKYQAIARVAAEKNVDQMDGLLYQARIEMVEGRDRDAVLTLERAVKQNEFLPSVRRLLASAYAKVGRTSDALNAYARAYEGKPDDVATARDYAQALVAANRGADALKVVSPETGILRFGQSDEGLVRIWLQLEAQFGDREKALRVRQQRFDKDPTLVENAVALNAMLIQDEKWNESLEVIATLEKNSEVGALSIAAMKANHQARRGSVEAGRDILRAYIDSLPESERSVRDYLTLAEYLIQNNRAGQAAVVLGEARAYQDSKLLEADRRMGDLAFEMGSVASNVLALRPEAEGDSEVLTVEDAVKQNFTEALQHYRRVLAAQHDDLVAKRAAETAVRLELASDAEQLLAPLVKAAPEDLQVLSLRAAISKLKKNDRETRQLLDRAVELYPSEPSTFVQRAMFTAEEPSLLGDALADFQQAERLRPSLVSTWVTHAVVLKKNGRVEDALITLKAGADANPSSDQLRIMFVQELLNAGKPELAQAEVMRFAAQRPDDTRWLEEAAGFMGRVGRLRAAGDLYERVFEIAPTPETAGKIIYMRLQATEAGTPPSKRDILKYVTEYDKLDTKGFTKEQMIPTLMLRSRARSFLGQVDVARNTLESAMDLIGSDVDAARFFSDELLVAVGSAEKVAQFLNQVEQRKPLMPFLRLTRVRAELASGKRAADLLTKTLAIEKDATDDVTRFEMYRLAGQLAYLAEEFRVCADAYIKALAISPESAQLNNDLAYALAVDLSSPSEALPYAEKAAELSPTSPVFDTLGWVHYLLERWDEAETILKKAATTARTPDQRLIAYAHLGLAQIKRGDTGGARDSLKAAEGAASDNPAAAQRFKVDLDALRKAVE